MSASLVSSQVAAGERSTPSEDSSKDRCTICQKRDRLLRCARCKSVYYCSKEHQLLDWKDHKKICKQLSKLAKTETTSSRPENSNAAKLKRQGINKGNENNDQALRADIGKSLHATEKGVWITPITFEGSSEDTILGAREESLNPLKAAKLLETPVDNTAEISDVIEMPEGLHNGIKSFPQVDFKSEKWVEEKCRKTAEKIDNICNYIIKDLNSYGVCVVDNFLSDDKGQLVLDEVLRMYSAGKFKDGQLVSNKSRASDLKTIRGDQITWLDGKEEHCTNISNLISKVDAIIIRANKMANNGKMGKYTINGRTKAMVACYPGYGSHYVKHVDNPNSDGRCITAIYYLNKDWDVLRDGGLLRIFPEGIDQVADIEPIFNRILFFWSDRRNPHEVQPAYKTRYAITLWYFDKEERNKACRRYLRNRENNSNNQFNS